MDHTLGQGHQTFSVKGQMEDILRFSSRILCQPNYSILRGTAPGSHMVGRSSLSIKKKCIHGHFTNPSAVSREFKCLLQNGQCCCAVLSRSVVSDSATPRTVAPGPLCPWDSPGRNTRVGCHALLRNLPDRGRSPGSPSLQVGSLPTETPGKPRTAIILSKSVGQDFA